MIDRMVQTFHAIKREVPDATVEEMSAVIRDRPDATVNELVLEIHARRPEPPLTEKQLREEAESLAARLAWQRSRK
jgi:hypothetical protein